MNLLLWTNRYTAPLIGGVMCFFLLTSCVVYRLVEDLDQQGHHNLLSPVMHGRGKYAFPSPFVASSARNEYDQQLDLSVVQPTVETMRVPISETVDSNLSYSIHQCPPTIPEGYPQAWNVVDVLSHWNPDDTEIPAAIHQGLCVIDWNDEEQRKIAERYRKAELPFLIHNHPEIWQATERWSHTDYLSGLLQRKPYRNEYSLNNHMMYWKLRGAKEAPHGWKAPTENVDITFDEWYRHAVELESAPDTTNAEHWYFRLNGEYEGRNGFLYDELPFFTPNESSFFMVDPSDQRGINCRFGSKGIIAELHYDFSRNFILLMKGQKRYIIAHPNQCRNMELHPAGHPSARHSRINWSDPKDWQTGRFGEAMVSEIVLQAGDALYLPTSWFHFIVSLNLNYQCNARSGVTYETQEAIHQCGF